MTSLPARRRDFARQTIADDELSIGPEIVLPELPEPSPAARVVLALFESKSAEIEIFAGPGLYLH